MRATTAAIRGAQQQALRTFIHNGNVREIDAPELSDAEVAGRVRMLLRSDVDHEAVCMMARDRILYLSQENERLRALINPAI